MGLALSEEIKQKLKNKIELRQYQLNIIKKLVEQLLKGKSVVVNLATGGGKTIIMLACLLLWLQEGKKILIVVENKILLKQLASELLANEVTDFTIIQGMKKPNFEARIGIAMIQTLALRNYDLTNIYDVCFIDECHHAVANQYDCVINAFPGNRLVGLTATIELSGKYPKNHRLAGKLKRLRHRFDTVVWDIMPRDLMALGYLVHAQVEDYTIAAKKRESMRTDEITGDFVISDAQREFDCPEVYDLAISEWRKKGTDSQGLESNLVFCCNVKHAKNAAKYYASQGIKAEIVLGTTPDIERDRIFGDLGKRKIDCVMTVDVVGEGFNLPIVSVMTHLRPTKSKRVWIQHSGRVLRIAPGKTRCLILDIADNCRSLNHHPLDSVNIYEVWFEPDEPKPKQLPGEVIEIEDEETKERKKKVREVVLLKFRGTRKGIEERTLERILKQWEQTKKLPKPYNKGWVYVQFVKSCPMPSIDIFKEMAKAVGYSPYWVEHGHRKADAFNAYVYGDPEWQTKLENQKEIDEILSWATEQSSTSYYSNSTSSGAKSNKIDLNPDGNNFYPQLENAFKKGKGGKLGFTAAQSLYRQLCKLLHPDLNPDVEVEKMINLSLAWEKFCTINRGF